MTAPRDKFGRPIVVVTGMGVVTSLGAGKADNWAKLTAGESGIRTVTRLPVDGLPGLRLRLWSGLGEVSLTQLEDVEMAATALEVAVSLDEGNVLRHEQLVLGDDLQRLAAGVAAT